MNIEGVRYARFLVRYVLATGERRRMVRWSPGVTFVYAEVARELVDRFGAGGDPRGVRDDPGAVVTTPRVLKTTPGMAAMLAQLGSTRPSADDRTVAALRRRGLLEPDPSDPEWLRISDAGLRELARWSKVELSNQDNRQRLKEALNRRYPTVGFDLRLYAQGATGFVAITCDDPRVHAFAAGYAAAAHDLARSAP